MKAYEFKGTKISSGIRTTERGDQTVISLGEKGRGRTQATVEIVSGHEHILNDIMAEATLRRIGEGLSMRMVCEALGAPDDEPSALLKASSLGAYVRGCSGKVRPLVGCFSIAQGVCAFGDAGRLGSAAEDLLLLAPGAVLIVNVTRMGHAQYLAYNGKELRAYPKDEWWQRGAVEHFANVPKEQRESLIATILESAPTVEQQMRDVFATIDQEAAR